MAASTEASNRDPVIEATDAEVQAAVDALKSRTLVIESSGARVARYSHNVGRVLRVPDQAVALLAALMLRGAQTSAELRTGTERLHRFADISSVEAFLEELGSRPEEQGGPLVKHLARRPGEREARWMHCLSGPPADEYASAQAHAPGPVDVSVSVSEIAALKAHVGRLEDEVAQLRARFDQLTRELGVSG